MEENLKATLKDIIEEIEIKNDPLNIEGINNQHKTIRVQKFINKNLPKDHKQTHDGVECQFCGKFLSHRKSLENHILSVHGKIKISPNFSNME